MYCDPKRSLYRIPDRNDKYSDRSSLWLKLLGEKLENVNKIRICSDHFVTSNLFTIIKYQHLHLHLHILN